MDDVDDLLYGNFEEAPMIDSLLSSPAAAPPQQIVIPKEVTEKPTQKAIEITQVEAERETSPQQNNGNRGGLLDPNVSKMGKMFIGGLSWETTDEGLRNYMQIYGEIEDVLIMKDSLTNRSRGFAFLTFKNPASIDKVLQTEHYIDGKKIDPKRAVPKEEYERAEKVFVGGVHTDVTEKEFKEYFEKFGTITEATIMFDRNTGRPRGFGFVTFSGWDGVQSVLDEQASRGVFLLGKRMEVKPASLRHQPLGATYPSYGMPGMINMNMSGYGAGAGQNGRLSYVNSPYNTHGADTGSQDGSSSDRFADRRDPSHHDDDHESARSVNDLDDENTKRGESKYRNAYGGDRLQRERVSRYDRDDRDWDDERYDRERQNRGRYDQNKRGQRGRRR